MTSKRRGRLRRYQHVRRAHLLRIIVVALFAGHLIAVFPLPAAEAADVVLSGAVTWDTEKVVPAGEVWELDPDVDTTITTSHNIIVEGVLRMRPANESVDHVIKFTGINEAGFQGGGMVPLTSDVGLWVMGSGILDAVGTEKVPWSYEWQSDWAGDEVVATPTAAGDYTTFKTVTSAAGVPAPNADGYKAELLNLTRNVRIEGTPSGKTHIMIKSTEPQHISYIAIRYVAPDFSDDPQNGDITGRYGLHFHHMGDDSRGSVVEGVVIRDADNHAFVPHASHGIMFQNTIAYNTTSETYWWDPSNGDACADSPIEGECNASHDTIYSGIVSALTQTNPYAKHKGGSIHLGAGDGNIIVNSVAVGLQGDGADNAAFKWPAGEVGVWGFESNTAHNNDGEGAFIWQNSPHTHVINGFLVYNNKKSGIEHGAYNNGYVWQNVTFRGNGVAIISHALGKDTDEPTDTDTQRWEAIDSDGGTLWVVGHNPNGGSKPVRFLECDFDLVLFEEGNDGGGLYDFIDCDLDVSDLDLTEALPDTIIRIQDNGSAIQVLGTGEVTDIPVFYTGPAPPPPPPPTTPPAPGAPPPPAPVPPPGGGSGGGGGTSPIFADIGGSIFEADIVWLAESGITKGCNPPSNTLFCPGSTVTRGQMAAFLVRALDLPDGGKAFTDVSDSVFEADINALAAAGITKGCNPPANTKFCPDAPVTRGQMAAFLVRALDLEAGPNAFQDDNGLVFEADINALAGSGITKGCNPPANTQFCPGSHVSREQMAAFLHRAEPWLPPQ